MRRLALTLPPLLILASTAMASQDMEDGGAVFWDAAVGANRFVFYASALLTTGLALFSIAMRRGPVLAKLGVASALVSGLSIFLGIGVGGAQMMGGGLEVFFAYRSWAFAAHTTFGLSAAVGIPGAVLLFAGHLKASDVGRKIVLGVGAAITIGAFIVTGHAATAPPVWIMTPVVALHLLAAAFWFGALGPLYVATRADSPAAAGRFMEQFSRLAIIAVSLLTISGLMIARVQVESFDGLLNTPYGGRLMVKLACFSILLGLAAYNKLLLTPRLIAGDVAAAAHLRRSIAVEVVIYLGILVVAATLSMVAPPRG